MKFSDTSHYRKNDVWTSSAVTPKKFRIVWCHLGTALWVIVCHFTTAATETCVVLCFYEVLSVITYQLASSSLQSFNLPRINESVFPVHCIVGLLSNCRAYLRVEEGLYVGPAAQLGPGRQHGPHVLLVCELETQHTYLLGWLVSVSLAGVCQAGWYLSGWLVSVSLAGVCQAGWYLSG